MTRLIRAELRRLLTTSLWRWTLPAAVLSGGGLTALGAAVGPENFDPPMPDLSTSAGVRLVLSMIGLTALIPALFGATAVTSEYRHSTITYTFLFEPRRHRVLSAKLLAYTVIGVVYGALTSGSAAVALYSVTAVKGQALGLPVPEVAAMLAGLAASMAVHTVLGVGIGALLRGQMATLIVLGAYLYLIENLLAIIPGIQTVYPFLPGGATAALTESSLMGQAAIEATGSAATLLPPVLGAAVLAGYALVAAAAAVVLPMRRDVT